MQKYRAEVLFTTNRNLPEDVDHKNLEVIASLCAGSPLLRVRYDSCNFGGICFVQRHLTLEEFMDIFDMTPEEFYMQPLWKRNEIKKRERLF